MVFAILDDDNSNSQHDEGIRDRKCIAVGFDDSDICACHLLCSQNVVVDVKIKLLKLYDRVMEYLTIKK